jgi:hypothetical protein
VRNGLVRDKVVVRLGGFGARKEGFRKAGTVAIVFLVVAVGWANK